MRSGKYTVGELFINRNTDQILIPELQRDYVWGEEQVTGLLDTIITDYHESLAVLQEEATGVARLNESLHDDFIRFYRREYCSSNIGFIYAYNDPEYAGKYFLIDGQQRLTTVYLLLLALSCRSGSTEHFSKRYFQEGVLKIDYKVRETAHDFFVNFVAFCLNNVRPGDPLSQFIREGKDDSPFEKALYDNSWFLSDYKNDVTVRSVTRNFQLIIKMLSGMVADCAGLADYVQNYTEFWYFDTDLSEQGEELYIYMNSRGEQMQPFENIKAELLEKLLPGEVLGTEEINRNNIGEVKEFWGKQFEEWQQFFWENRHVNENADNGFNELLRWIRILQLSAAGDEDGIAKLIGRGEEEEIKKAEKLSSTDFTVHDINFIMVRLEKLFFTGLRHVHRRWLGSKEPLSKIILFRLLPVLNILARSGAPEDVLQLPRFIRFFYNLSRVSVISKSSTTSLINALALSDVIAEENIYDPLQLLRFAGQLPPDRQDRKISRSLLSDDEIFKLRLYVSPPDGHSREQLEELFAGAEDFDLNDGRISFVLSVMNTDVRNEPPADFDPAEFRAINKAFMLLFKKPGNLLRRALLSKGDYLLHSGSTPSLGGQRYTFVEQDRDAWRRVVWDREKGTFVRDLIRDFRARTGREPDPDDKLLHTVLVQIINDFRREPGNAAEWIRQMVDDRSLLDWCEKKNVCWVDDRNVYLLKYSKVTDERSYRKLEISPEKQVAETDSEAGGTHNDGL